MWTCGLVDNSIQRTTNLPCLHTFICELLKTKLHVLTVLAFQYTLVTTRKPCQTSICTQQSVLLENRCTYSGGSLIWGSHLSNHLNDIETLDCRCMSPSTNLAISKFAPRLNQCLLFLHCFSWSFHGFSILLFYAKGLGLFIEEVDYNIYVSIRPCKCIVLQCTSKCIVNRTSPMFRGQKVTSVPRFVLSWACAWLTHPRWCGAWFPSGLISEHRRRTRRRMLHCKRHNHNIIMAM